MWTLGSEVEGDTPVQRWEEEDREGDVRPNVSGRGKNGVGLEQETGVGGDTADGAGLEQSAGGSAGDTEGV